MAAVKRKSGETAKQLADRIAADNHSETEQGWSIQRAIEEVELDLAEAVRLLYSCGLDDRGSCNECGAERVGDSVGQPGAASLEMHAATCPLRVLLSRMDEGKRG